jgi:hypothetical protein
VLQRNKKLDKLNFMQDCKTEKRKKNKEHIAGLREKNTPWLRR